MKKIWTILLVTTGLAKQSISYGQNLVPNNSYEIFDTCPDAQAQIARAVGWSIYSQAGTTPDYYNACDTGGLFCVPNGFSFNQAAIDGYAYAAVVTFNSGLVYREHIGIQLSQPLAIGQKYFLSFYTTMGGVQASSTPSNNIGMLLSTIAYDQNNPSPINNFAHLYSTAIISDTVNWMYISGSIIADSAYNYCILGNFFDNSNTDTIKWNVNSTYSYYAVDMICISTDSLTCNGSVGINTMQNKRISLVIYPNPTSGMLNIKKFNYTKIKGISIYNTLGKKVKSLKAAQTIFIGSLPKGLYLIQLINDSGIIHTEKFIIE